MNPHKEGDRILGRWEGGPFWFSGRVHSTSGDSIAVQYDDGTAEILAVGDVKPFDWKVGTRVEAIWSGDGGWYTAWIMEMNDDASICEVRFEDGIREQVPTGSCRAR